MLTREAMDPKFGHVFIYEHCLPFDVSRAFDEASGITHPRIWTAQRDKEMWAALQDWRVARRRGVRGRPAVVLTARIGAPRSDLTRAGRTHALGDCRALASRGPFGDRHAPTASRRSDAAHASASASLPLPPSNPPAPAAGDALLFRKIAWRIVPFLFSATSCRSSTASTSASRSCR
jgi:hypothetical protein